MLKTYAVIGDPIEHSLSPTIHNAAYRELGIECTYIAYRVIQGDLVTGIESLKKINLSSTTPPTFDSYGLAKVIKEKGYKKCLIFCGEKKPRILSLTDIEIDTFPCYASHDEAKIDLSKIQDQDKLVVLIYTQQSLEVLVRELPRKKVQNIILVAASKRIKELSLKYGFKNCILADSPHDEEMIKAALIEN